MSKFCMYIMLENGLYMIVLGFGHFLAFRHFLMWMKASYLLIDPQSFFKRLVGRKR